MCASISFWPRPATWNTRSNGFAVSPTCCSGKPAFIDKFHGHGGEGVLWLHGYGNVFEKVLAAGETIDIEPGGWLYKDPQVKMDTVVDRLTSGLFGAGVNFIVNRFTGPGRVGIQSMYLNNSTSDR
ncbi:biogenesis AIM24 protein [Paraburkholderia sp. BL21I4N1]|nr:biogenesis AIM24 protein [Paraburkholderia sp. BL21I4N1]